LLYNKVLAVHWTILRIGSQNKHLLVTLKRKARGGRWLI